MINTQAKGGVLKFPCQFPCQAQEFRCRPAQPHPTQAIDIKEVFDIDRGFFGA
jgi:hypothetical protein